MGSNKTITTSNIIANAGDNLLVGSNFVVGTSNLFVDTATGRVGVGTNSPNYSLEIVANDGIKIPFGTSEQRPLGNTGIIRFNTSINQYEAYIDNAWKILVTNGPYDASIAQIGRSVTVDPRYDDESPYNSYGYYVESNTNAALYSDYISRFIWYRFTYDTVIYDHSPNQDMTDLNNDRLYASTPGFYLLTWKSSILHPINFYYRIYVNDVVVYSSAIYPSITTNYKSYGHVWAYFSHLLNLNLNDYVYIELYHERNSHTIFSYDVLGNAGIDYAESGNDYNIEYMKEIAARMTLKLIPG